jgi:hypothetical protein
MIIRLSLVKDRKDSSFNAQATLLMLILLIDTPVVKLVEIGVLVIEDAVDVEELDARRKA